MLNQAETALQNEIRQNCPGIDEEAITQNFHARFAESLRSASSNKRIEAAFAKDLAASSLARVRFNPQSIARSLVAEVTLHKRKTEGKTGGDLGIVIMQPNVQLQNFSLEISRYKRGLLTQAKLKRHCGWPSFSANQRKVLPGRLGYLALLLYSYADEARRELMPFAWQLGARNSWSELERMLREDTLEPVNSTKIINDLSAGRIGTADNSIIENTICPDHNAFLTLVIDWPPGEAPASRLNVLSRYQTTEQRLFLRR